MKTKKIVIDVYPISTPYVGVGEFCRQLGEHLAKHATMLRTRYGLEFYFLLPPQFKGCFGDDVHYICIPAFLRCILPLFPIQADLFHTPYQYSRVGRLHYAKKQLLTIHDINFFYEKKGKNLEKSIRKFQQKIERTDYVNYISRFVHEDTAKHFHILQPQKVIYNGATDLSNSLQPNHELTNLPNNFLFHISSLQPKKNVQLLIEMMDFLPEENLLIVGDWNSVHGKTLQLKIKACRNHNIYMLSNVKEAEKAFLYKTCRAFLFPSLCEGFGLPPIEAMKFGKPVFLSTLTSLPEIGGKDAFYWENLTPESMAGFVKRQLAFYAATPSYAKRIKQSVARLTWEHCTEQYIKYFLEILSGNPLPMNN